MSQPFAEFFQDMLQKKKCEGFILRIHKLFYYVFLEIFIAPSAVAFPQLHGFSMKVISQVPANLILCNFLFCSLYAGIENMSQIFAEIFFTASLKILLSVEIRYNVGKIRYSP